MTLKNFGASLYLLASRLRGASIFISHSTKDLAEAQAVGRHLKGIGFTKVFIASQSIHGGDDWFTTILRMLKRSRAVVLLLSEKSRDSQWCFAEVITAMSIRKVIIPIELDSSADTAVDEICRPHYQYIPRVPHGIDFNELDRSIKEKLIAPGEDWSRVAQAWPVFAAVALLVIAPPVAVAWSWVDRQATLWVQNVKAEQSASDVIDVLKKGPPPSLFSVVPPLRWWVERSAISKCEALVRDEVRRSDDPQSLKNSTALFDKLDGSCSGILFNDPLLANEANRDAQARRATNALIALDEWRRGGRYDRADLVELLRLAFRGREDNRFRSFVISGDPIGRVKADVLSALVDEKTPEAILYAVILALGRYSYVEIDDLTLPGARLVCGEGETKDRQPIHAWLLDLRMLHPSRGVHGAADWLVRKWGLERKFPDVARVAAQYSPIGRAEWRMNSDGITMVLIDPSKDLSASLRERKPEWAMKPKFFISAGEITRWQCERAGPQPELDYPMDGTFPALAGAPGGLSWTKAAIFCNELGGRSRPPLKPRYRVEDGKVLPVLEKKEDDGYRLPTEIEWEIATRAGSATMRFYGFAPHLLKEYAWVDDSPPGNQFVQERMPNPFGLFDVYGGVQEWCEGPANEPDASRHCEGLLYPADTYRVVRGGMAIVNPEPPHSKTCNCGRGGVDTSTNLTGFRVVQSPGVGGK